MLFTIDDPFDREEQYDNLAEEVAAWFEENAITFGVRRHFDGSETSRQWVDFNRKPSGLSLRRLHNDLGAFITRQEADYNQADGNDRVWFGCQE